MGEKYGSGSWLDRSYGAGDKRINRITEGWVFQRANKRTGLIEYYKHGLGSDTWTRTLYEATVFEWSKSPGAILHTNYRYEIVKVNVVTKTEVVRA